jgi:myosin heavy subunit
LAYLLKQEKEQQRLLESELRDLREQHERVAVEREKLRANQTQLQTELDQLAQVKKELIDLTRERDELRDRRGSLDADRKQLAGEQAAFEVARDRFDREKKLAVAEQDKLAASVAKLEKQNAALEAVAQRLNQQTRRSIPTTPPSLSPICSSRVDDDGGGNVTTAAPAAAAATSVAAATARRRRRTPVRTT